MAVNKTLSFDPQTAAELEQAASYSDTNQSTVVKAGIKLVSAELVKDPNAVKRILCIGNNDVIVVNPNLVKE